MSRKFEALRKDLAPLLGVHARVGSPGGPGGSLASREKAFVLISSSGQAAPRRPSARVGFLEGVTDV
jgi:hypothetical protein